MKIIPLGERLEEKINVDAHGYPITLHFIAKQVIADEKRN